MNPLQLAVRAEVADAVKTGRPVVALESTLPIDYYPLPIMPIAPACQVRTMRMMGIFFPFSMGLIGSSWFNESP